MKIQDYETLRQYITKLIRGSYNLWLLEANLEKAKELMEEYQKNLTVEV